MYKRLCMTFLAVVCALQMMADYNVRNFGAKGDGATLDSPAINAAIEEAVKHGGGRVVVPAGRYLSGSIRMKSNIELCIEAGAVIIAAPASMKAYDKSEEFGFPEYQDGGHTYFHNSLIWADGEENVAQFKFSVASSRGANQRWCIHDTGRTGCPQCHAAVL